MNVFTLLKQLTLFSVVKVYNILYMSFTRFYDDPCRISKQLQESTDPGRYMLSVPGNGLTPCFMEDPHIRLQKWGANLQTNTINLESDLLGLTKRLNKDIIDQKPTMIVHSNKVDYPVCQPYTEQPRATHPAWMVRDLEQNNFQYLPLDPQENTCFSFQNNLNTRLIESDNFKTNAPKCVTNHPGELNLFPFSGKSEHQGLCNSSGTCGTV
jgi:hypothetical protein